MAAFMKLLAALFAFLLAGSAFAQTTPAAASPVGDAENIWNLDLSTGGRVTVQLRPDIAPNHVERIRTLSEQGFYDGLIFHRVIPGFMAQGGDPQGTGQGGSQLPDLEPEFTKTPHLRGTVSMARAQTPNSANSQFFIVFQPRTQLDGEYTVFGRVTGGMQYVDAINVGEPPENPSRIIKARIGANVPLPDFTPENDAISELQSQLPPGAASATFGEPDEAAETEGENAAPIEGGAEPASPLPGTLLDAPTDDVPPQDVPVDSEVDMQSR
jgi:peptidylprolyl isomerase|tara:strand:+ start:31042 stop:31851 length:810 start_codon:yes stop_codon:yes gene_type:complete